MFSLVQPIGGQWKLRGMLTNDVKPERCTRRLNRYHSDHVGNGIAFHDSEGEKWFFKRNWLQGWFGFGDPFNVESSG